MIDKAMTTQYQLFAIMIHQGSAASGHYFIFVYNESQRKWRKYNDRFVTEVTLEEVQKISLGETNKDTNATCLI
jgi:ubiquitin carboxyl-terminal hydrolase 25/28